MEKDLKAFSIKFIMLYPSIRFKKYYDALRYNKSFFRTSFNQRNKILWNSLKFLKSKLVKPLIINNKPVTAQIEPTSLCNLKCEMCIKNKIDVPIGSMSFENFKKILNELDSLFKIYLSGQGEPFLNPELFDMIKYADKRGITISITTSGTLLTKEMIDKICDVEIGEIGVSLESTNKKEYEKIRKGAKFDKVMKNVMNLNSQLSKNKKKTIVSFAVTILKKNINELPEFVKLAKKIGIKKIIIQTLQEKEDYVSKYSKEAKSQRVINLDKELKVKINEAKNLAKEYRINLIFDEEKSTGCIWPWRGIYITWNGYVTVCCKIPDYRNPLIGNFFKEDFWKIWNGKHYQMFRKLLRKRKAPLPCKGCNEV